MRNYHALFLAPFSIGTDQKETSTLSQNMLAGNYLHGTHGLTR